MGISKLKENLRIINKADSFLSGLIDRNNNYRCSYCNHIFFFGNLGSGTLIEVKCPKCKECTPFGVVK